jgi:REP element-mobilizing transposase RayT
MLTAVGPFSFCPMHEPPLPNTFTLTDSAPEPKPDLDLDPLAVVRALTKPYTGMGEALGRRKWRRVKGLVGHRSTCFHLMSRICEGVPFFDEMDKEALVLVLRRLSRFCGIQLLTYCVMGNHFHALIRVPDRDQWLQRFAGPEGDARLMEHLRTLYSKSFVELLTAQWMRWRQDGRDDLLQASKAAILKRFCDISMFGKEVKARFARWFNKRHARRGVLWMNRFKSVLVESPSQKSSSSQVDTLKVMAAYIDLNPVRAGLVEGAEDYRWSGWGAALNADKEAIVGLCDVVECSPMQWDKGGRSTYQVWISERRPTGNVEGPSPVGFLMQPVRAFTGGIAIGSAHFVEQVFEQCRDQFGAHRASGARPIMRQNDQTERTFGLRALRDLRTTPTDTATAPEKSQSSQSR